MNKNVLYKISLIALIFNNIIFAAQQGKKIFTQDDVIPIEEENFFELTKENFNTFKNNFNAEMQQEIKESLERYENEEKEKNIYLKGLNTDFNKTRIEQTKFIEHFPEHIKKLSMKGPNLKFYLVAVLYQIYDIHTILKIFNVRRQLFDSSFCLIFPHRSLKDIIDTVSEKIEGGFSPDEIVLLTMINEINENSLKFHRSKGKAEFILVEMEHFQKNLNWIVKKFDNIAKSERAKSRLIMKVLRLRVIGLFNELISFSVSTLDYLLSYLEDILNKDGTFTPRLPHESFSNFTEYIGRLRALALSGTPLIKTDCEFLAKSYHEVYSACLKLSLIPHVTLYNNNVFDFPSRWDEPLIDASRKEEERKKQEQALLLEIESEQDQEETSSIKKNTKKKKKKQKESPEESSSVATESYAETSTSTNPINVQYKISKEKIDPLRHAKIKYSSRIQDWFLNPEKALTLQGYQGTESIPFKENLLKNFGKEAIIFNHKFPKVIDTFLLDNPKIEYEKNGDKSFSVSVPGYYNEKNKRQFGLFEISFFVREVDAKKNKKQVNKELERDVFHRFFRPVENLSSLIQNKKKIEEVRLGQYEVEAAVSDDQGWTTSSEQEGWQVNLAKEDDGYITVSHPEYPVSYVLLLN